MALEDRNFRSIYYGKVGFKGIEEKKSLEIILKEEPIDYVKLSQFCLKFPIPTGFRYFIWQVLLGVLPVYQSAHTVASEQRKLQFEELKQALMIMRKIDRKTPQEMVFLKMYLIEEKNLPFDDDSAKLVEDNLPFFQIAKVVSELVSEDVRAFWLSVKITALLEKNSASFRHVSSDIETILTREDSDFCQYLRKNHHLQTIPLQTLFLSAFATIFPEDYLERIWDRIIGGSSAYLCYVFAAILLVMKRQMLASSDLSKVLGNVTADHSEVILSMSTELWSRDGCPLHMN